MAVRLPLFMEAVVGETAGKMIYPFNASGMNELHKLAGHAYALSPNPRIEVSGSLGDPLPGATFTDTWWSAGASTTDVTNYDTASETPNVFMVTDTYNSLRLVYDVDASPFSSDTNNTQFPLYLYSPEGPDGDDWPTAGLRTMTNQDFVQTFIIPTLDQFHGGGSSLEQGGTYFMTTSSAPANATVVGIAALNQEANPAAYSAASIPETPLANNTVTTYRIAKVNWSPTASTLYESGANYDLPLYYDSGTESIKQHSPATWAALLNPFLRYYLSGQAGVAYKLSYNVGGADGVTNGTLYQDTRITTAGTSYQQRFVNANDYRTQEFPTGTATAQGASKAFKIHRGVNEVITLLGSSGSPQTFTSDGPQASSTTTRSPTTGQDYNSSTDYWQVVTGTPLSADDGSGTFSNGGRVTVRRNNVPIYYETFEVASDATSLSEVTVGAVTYHKGTLEDGSGVYMDAFGIYDVETTYEARNGFKFTSTGNIERTTYVTFIAGTEVTHSTSEWCNVTPGATRYIRFTDDTSATMGGSARSPSSGFDYTEGTYEWRLTQSASGTATNISLKWNGAQVAAQSWSTFAQADAVTSISVGAYTYDRAGNASQGYSYTTLYGLARTGISTVSRMTPNTGDALNTWHSLATDKEFRWGGQQAIGSYGARFAQCKVEIASDAAGTDILATGYYNTDWNGGGDVQFSNMSGSGIGSNGLSGSASADFYFLSNGTASTAASASGGVISNTGTPQTWLVDGAAADYEVNFNWTHTPNGGGSTTAGPSAASWVACDTDRLWEINDSATAMGQGTMSGLVSIRQTSDNVVLASGYVTLTVDHEP